MITLTIKEKNKLRNNLFLRDKKFLQDVRKNFIIAGTEFITGIRKRWYDGRNSDDTGLNRISHMLHNTWQAEVRSQGLDIVAVISNGMKYGKAHEFGVPKRNLPQRSFVRKDLKNPIGKDLFTQAIKDALRAF